MTSMEHESETSLSIVVSLDMEIMKFVNVSEIQFLSGDVIFVELEEVRCARHPLVDAVVILECFPVVNDEITNFNADRMDDGSFKELKA